MSTFESSMTQSMSTSTTLRHSPSGAVVLHAIRALARLLVWFGRMRWTRDHRLPPALREVLELHHYRACLVEQVRIIRGPPAVRRSFAGGDNARNRLGVGTAHLGARPARSETSSHHPTVSRRRQFGCSDPSAARDQASSYTGSSQNPARGFPPAVPHQTPSTCSTTLRCVLGEHASGGCDPQARGCQNSIEVEPFSYFWQLLSWLLASTWKCRRPAHAVVVQVSQVVSAEQDVQEPLRACR